MKSLLLSALLAFASFGAVAAGEEADLMKVLSERLPSLYNLPPGAKIDEVRPAAVPGLFEVRIGTEILYSDAKGDFLIEGEIIDARLRRNLTKERIEKLTAIDFAQLPLKDAIVWKTGTGKRRLAIFADPNCGYCKRFERDLQNVKDVTVYTFVIPILGGDSPEKSRAIWCAKDTTATWRSWMLEGTAPPRVLGQCDSSAIDRNLALSRKIRVNGTPAVVFEDGTRAPGAIPAAEVERRFTAIAAKS